MALARRLHFEFCRGPHRAHRPSLDLGGCRRPADSTAGRHSLEAKPSGAIHVWNTHHAAIRSHHGRSRRHRQRVAQRSRFAAPLVGVTGFGPLPSEASFCHIPELVQREMRHFSPCLT